MANIAKLESIAHKKLTDTDLTIQDLMSLVDQIVTEHLKAERTPTHESAVDLSDWWQSMVNEIIVPAPGNLSATDMLREEREQWYKPS